MKLNTKKLLSNKYVLYFIAFLAITNIIAFMRTDNYNGLSVFALTGFISTYYTKNMSVILGLSLVLSNIVSASSSYVETMKNKTEEHNEDETKEHTEEQTDETNKTGNKKTTGKQKASTKQGFTQKNIPSGRPAPVSESMEDEEIGERIDYASTLEQAYDNLQNMLGDDGIQSLTKDTQNLISQQKSLMGTMKDMGPMLKMAKDTLGGFNGGEMKEAMSSLQGLMGGFNKTK